MNKGILEQLCDPMTLYQKPATRFVAGFVWKAQGQMDWWSLAFDRNQQFLQKLVFPAPLSAAALPEAISATSFRLAIKHFSWMPPLSKTHGGNSASVRLGSIEYCKVSIEDRKSSTTQPDFSDYS
jgi:ABC-type sugar transport system ATPase subunit